MQDSATNCSTTSTGTIAEKIPSSESSRFTPANKSRNGRLSVCLAIALLLSGFFKLSTKNGGLLTIASKTPAAFKPSAVSDAPPSAFKPSAVSKASAASEVPPKSCSLQHSISTLSRNGLAITFSLACPQASASISIPTTSASGKRCAIMSEISPVPEPMSRIRLPPCAHAPSKTPSVPTFMAQRSCSISNCLNRKLPINSSVSLQKKTNAPPIYFIASSRNCHFHLQKQLLTSIKTGINI